MGRGGDLFIYLGFAVKAQPLSVFKGFNLLRRA